MSTHESIDVFDSGIGKDKKHCIMPAVLTFSVHPIGHDQYPPQNQAVNGVSDFVDGSGPIFSMYLEMVTEEDKKMAENWKADADCYGWSAVVFDVNGVGVILKSTMSNGGLPL
jgi:hypothetical protein